MSSASAVRSNSLVEYSNAFSCAWYSDLRRNSFRLAHRSIRLSTCIRRTARSTRWNSPSVSPSNTCSDETSLSCIQASWSSSAGVWLASLDFLSSACSDRAEPTTKRPSPHSATHRLTFITASLADDSCHVENARDRETVDETPPDHARTRSIHTEHGV